MLSLNNILYFSFLLEKRNILFIAVIALSCVVALLLLTIGLLLWRHKRVPVDKRNTSDTYTCEKSGGRETPRDQPMSDPGTYMELQSRPSEIHSRSLSECQTLQGKRATPGYYNVGFNKGKMARDEEVYDEIGSAHDYNWASRSSQ